MIYGGTWNENLDATQIISTQLPCIAPIAPRIVTTGLAFLSTVVNEQWSIANHSRSLEGRETDVTQHMYRG
jgi:hypothetical protein